MVTFIKGIIMTEGTKERILEAALELFAQNGYLGTSMNDIAARLGFTKAALYKHYASKQEILDRIVERMNRLDDERAEAYEMPEAETDGFAEAYMHTPIQRIRAYSLAQFDHWTKEVGGHRWFQTKNAKKPEREPATEVHVRGGYSAKRPPRAPTGYTLVEVKTTKYGYHYFKYVWMPPKSKEKRRLEITGGGLVS